MLLLNCQHGGRLDPEQEEEEAGDPGPRTGGGGPWTQKRRRRRRTLDPETEEEEDPGSSRFGEGAAEGVPRERDHREAKEGPTLSRGVRAVRAAVELSGGHRREFGLPILC